MTYFQDNSTLWQIKSALGFAAAAAAALVIAYPISETVQAKDDGERVELRATDTGIEAIDEQNRDESVENALRQFRELAAQAREAAGAAGDTALSLMENQLTDLKKQAEKYSDTARAEWDELKSRIDELRLEARVRLDDAASRSEQEWREARDDAADALERLASELKRARKATDSDGRKD